MFGWYIAPGVEIEGISPEGTIIMHAFAAAFNRNGYDCHFTSIIRDDPLSLHDRKFGRAVDADAVVDLDAATWGKIEADAKARLGDGFDVLVHRGRSGRLHLHGECDPTGNGVAGVTVHA